MDRLEKLIRLLQVCPFCVEGFIYRPDFTNKSTIPYVVDTTTKTIAVKCTSLLCNKSITFNNPYYQQFDSKISLSDGSNFDTSDLFG